jgi:DNA-directed RNA polymerase specialized sigma subunit
MFDVILEVLKEKQNKTKNLQQKIPHRAQRSIKNEEITCTLTVHKRKFYKFAQSSQRKYYFRQ